MAKLNLSNIEIQNCIKCTWVVAVSVLISIIVVVLALNLLCSYLSLFGVVGAQDNLIQATADFFFFFWKNGRVVFHKRVINCTAENCFVACTYMYIDMAYVNQFYMCLYVEHFYLESF